MISQNKKARFSYHLLDRFEAGIVLQGWEVKRVLEKKFDLSNAYVKIIDSQVYLINSLVPAEITSIYQNNCSVIGEVCNPSRPRKLLLHRKEITQLYGLVSQKKFTLIPTKAYMKSGRLKIEFFTAKGKNHADKRQSVMLKDTNKQLQREVKNKIQKKS